MNMIAPRDAIAPSPSRADVRNLSVLQYAQGFTLWHYKAPPGISLGLTLEPGYWSVPAGIMIQAGDMLMISAGENGAQVYFSSISPVRVRIMAGTVA